MTRIPVVPPDGADWSISAETIDGGVALVVEYELAGEPAGVRLRLGRDEARSFAQGILDAAGDGTGRTSPHARILEAARQP